MRRVAGSFFVSGQAQVAHRSQKVAGLGVGPYLARGHSSGE
jgi:hypothetical protein